MAKQKQDAGAVADAPADFKDPALEPSQAASSSDAPPSELPADVEAMQRRIAELEGRLKVHESAVGPGPASTGYWLVELEHQPPHIVPAADPGNAWEKYKTWRGIISSEFPPKISIAAKEHYDRQQVRFANEGDFGVTVADLDDDQKKLAEAVRPKPLP